MRRLVVVAAAAMLAVTACATGSVEASGPERFRIDYNGPLPVAVGHIVVICDTENGNLLYLTTYRNGVAVVEHGCR